jgi:hypothetical protein
LAAAGVDTPETDRLAASVMAQDGKPRFVWEEVPVAEADYVVTVLASVRQKRRWRAEYDAAKESRDAARASPGQPVGPVDSNSATTSPRAPDSRPNQVA